MAHRIRRYGRFASATLSDLWGFGRFTRTLRRFLAGRLSLDDARAIVRRRLEAREGNFLRLVERAVYGHPQSPYRPLLRLAGCEFADLRESVKTRGMEQTLRALRDAGVYVTYEEFKGRRPIERGGRTFSVTPLDFANPSVQVDYRGRSGGTTGSGTPVPISLDRVADEAPPFMLMLDAHGLFDAPSVMWKGILPDSSGMNSLLRAALYDRVPVRWFTPIHPGAARRRLVDRIASPYLATYAIVLAGRAMGVRLPWPEPLPLDRADVVARCVADLLKRSGACMVRAFVSPALRISLAAQDAGLDLTGATFVAGGEPPTPGKVEAITRSGARFVPNYAFTEGGLAGIACARPAGSNDLHVRREAFALIQAPRQLAPSGDTVHAFHFTTLLPSASMVLLNVESDDCGILDTRSCGCPLEQDGYIEHVREIRSFAKLTSEGEAILSSDLVRILEEVLPARFGGSPLDYQLVEEEEAAGFTRISLVVSPRVALTDEAAAIETVLNAIPDGGARAIWRQARTLRIRRTEPISTGRGKSMPLVPLRASGSVRDDPVA